MEFDGFDWDEGNRLKCQSHGLTLAEIESVFSASPLMILPDRTPHERRLRAIGTGSSGRKVFVAFTMRGDTVRPISARYMHKREVSAYEEAYPDLRD